MVGYLNETKVAAGNGGLCDSNVTQYSGYYKIDAPTKTNEHYFYWMFESRSNPKTVCVRAQLVHTAGGGGGGGGGACAVLVRAQLSVNV